MAPALTGFLRFKLSMVLQHYQGILLAGVCQRSDFAYLMYCVPIGVSLVGLLNKTLKNGKVYV
jgi:hypothetical protein